MVSVAELRALGFSRQTGLRHAVRKPRACAGPRALRKVIATGTEPTRSTFESILLDSFLDAGLEHPDVNKPIRVNGHRVVPDFRWPSRRLIVEAGIAWHDRTLDAERRALREAAGERVIQVTWEQAILDPAALIRLLPSRQPQ